MDPVDIRHELIEDLFRGTGTKRVNLEDLLVAETLETLRTVRSDRLLVTVVGYL